MNTEPSEREEAPDIKKVVTDFVESWSVSSEAANALVLVIEQVCRDAQKQQAEIDARIAESFQYSTRANPYNTIARAILREAGIGNRRRRKAAANSVKDSEGEGVNHG